MSDRQLLEDAAKAAGIAVEWRESVKCYCYSESPYNVAWNPLADDGDALRLVVRLGIKVMPYPMWAEPKHSVIASKRVNAPPDDDENTYVGPEAIEVYGEDPYAATRRAITRAAAEMWRAQQGDKP